MRAPSAWLWLGLVAAVTSLGAWLYIALDAQAGGAVPGAAPWLLAPAVTGPLALLAMVIVQLRHGRAERQMVQSPRTSERHDLLELLDLMPVAVAVQRSDAPRSMLNKAMAKLFAVERADALELPWDWQDHVAPQDWPNWMDTLLTVRRTGQPQWLQTRLRTAGDEQEVLAHVSRLAGDTPTDAALAVVVSLAEDAQALQANLQLRELLDMAEQEKWMFGQAVHDELGQRLSGIAYFAKTLERKLQAVRPAEADDAGWLTHLANESMGVARGLARGLVPIGTDDPEALRAALEELCATTGKMFSARCTLSADPRFDPGGAARANHLYHVVQELITNAVKHGAAGEVQVVMACEPAGQHIHVRNSGRGLPASAAAGRTGMGLHGVRSRVAYLNGKFTLVDLQAGGVLATIELPPHARAEALPLPPEATNTLGPTHTGSDASDGKSP